ncbi:Protein of unknown function (DUF2971) [Seleniivibrio woodruffii]|uniref:DUF2971 family protein n=2 Tax=Seleniivibrio woodruffii TaxID=1078050 RepID=A0A4R1K6R8_9BACT|nr:DUF2971 domain-containing protein [Seleniivibrio woodruffii]TCK59922.1 hypothetical protein C8D98_2089 [Seleniivibrio woodruffii]TVZ35857.1 Protein of unknown function (DUF2971) [Seleniivibrio woodruffii]
MLVKYYGFYFDNNSNKHILRDDFISNGFFRITQPKFLNDKGSEAKLFPYFNEFSPADLAWARKRHDKIQKDPNYTPSEEELINFFLKPVGERYGEHFPHLLRMETDYETMDEYDKDQFTNIVEKMNHYMIEIISCQLGVLSLCKSDTNELMWTHYASAGEGIAVTFKESHEFFKKYVPKDVSYLPEKRASLTYYKGSIRINGEPIKTFTQPNITNPFAALIVLNKNGVDIQNFTERLIYAKAEKWKSEDEVRIICMLNSCEHKTGKVITPKLDIDFPQATLHSYSEICLKKIPFDAFESIVLGYGISKANKNMIIEKVKANPELSHIKIKIAQHNIYGNLETTEINT